MLFGGWLAAGSGLVHAPAFAVVEGGKTGSSTERLIAVACSTDACESAPSICEAVGKYVHRKLFVGLSKESGLPLQLPTVLRVISPPAVVNCDVACCNHHCYVVCVVIGSIDEQLRKGNEAYVVLGIGITPEGDVAVGAHGEALVGDTLEPDRKG